MKEQSLHARLKQEFVSCSTGESIDDLILKPGSHAVCTWRCRECGQEWKTPFYTRAQGHGCPKCRKKEGARKKNRAHVDQKGSLADHCPELVKEWDRKRNETGPDEVSPGSEKSVWWKCSRCGHVWRDSVYDRTRRHRGCPECRKKRMSETSLGRVCLESLAYWSEKNEDTPYDVSSGSPRQVYWKCPKCGHEWKAGISGFKRGRRCPSCAGKVVTEKNSFSSVYPEYAQYWDTERNGILPEQAFAFSNKKYWFHCPACGNSVKKQLSRLASRPLLCPECTKRNHTSYGEQFLYFYFSKYIEQVENRYILDGREIDVYLPKEKIAIEYNGVYYHEHRLANDKRKEAFFREQGLHVIRIYEGDDPSILSDEDAFFVSKRHLNEDLTDVARYLLDRINPYEEHILDVEKDRAEILRLYYSSPVRNAFSKKYPYLVEEWNWEKNGDLSPNLFSAGSHVKVWWRCEKGHEWQAPIYSRTSGKKQCPYCHGNRLLPGFNDLKTEYPDLVERYWGFELNEKLGVHPDKEKKTSEKKVYWKTEKGDIYLGSIASRVRTYRNRKGVK